jgi:hypothetical protein
MRKTILLDGHADGRGRISCSLPVVTERRTVTGRFQNRKVMSWIRAILDVCDYCRAEFGCALGYDLGA